MTSTISDDMGGPWLAEMYAEHLAEDLAFDEGLIQAVINFCQPGNTLDLGCGEGRFVQWLRANGVDAWGAEPADLGSVFRAPGYQIYQDISQPFDLKQNYDLVICTEVVEHIPVEFEDIVFDNMVKHMNKYLLFSGATPGQGGTGHVNEQPESHWFSHLVRRGLQLVLNASIDARLASTLSWYQNNITIWELAAGFPQDRVPVAGYADAIAERDSQLLSSQATYQRFISQANSQIEALKIELGTTQGHVSWFQSKFSQAQSELAGSQTQLAESQTQLAESQTQLAESQTQLARSQSHLNQFQGVLTYTQSQLLQTQAEVQVWRDRTQQEQACTEEVRTRFKNKRSQLQQKRAELQASQERINAMESSKFWKLRKGWFKLRRSLGLATNE
jgi:SAM-dependent methyltransferase